MYTASGGFRVPISRESFPIFKNIEKIFLNINPVHGHLIQNLPDLLGQGKPRLQACPLDKFTSTLCSHVSKPNSEDLYNGLQVTAETEAGKVDSILLRGNKVYLPVFSTEAERFTPQMFYRSPETR